MDIFDKFEEAIDFLYKENNYLAAEVAKLGYPRFAEYIPTAGVGWDPTKKRIFFDFNVNFYNKLSVEQLAFVLAHESSHIFNGHIFSLSRELNKMKRFNKTKEEMSNYRYKFNIAADCVVNDSLTILYGLSKVLDSLMTPVYGQPIVGFDCHDMTAHELIPLIPDNTKSGGNGDHDGWESFFDENGNPNKDFVDAVKDFLDSKKENSALSDKESSDVSELEKNIKDFAGNPQAGKGTANTKRPVDSGNSESLCWNKLLFDFIDSKRVEENWVKSPRQLISTYPEVILPSFKEKEQYELFIAIDTSGSIDFKALSLFIFLVKNTPKNFKIRAITFDTKCYEYDIKENKQPIGGGGTSFRVIEKYIQDNLKKYPKIVFVLTDGCGDSITPEFPSNWAFLLYGPCDKSYIPAKSKSYKIFDLLRK